MINAITITGVLASRSSGYKYFTTTLYPFVVDDEISVSQIVPQTDVLWENPNDDMTISTPIAVSGTLEETIVYINYNDGAIEDVGVQTPAALSGTLVETIVFKEYNDGAIEDVGVQTPAALSGTLVETIVYINYNNGEIEDMGVQTPIIISGTLE